MKIFNLKFKTLLTAVLCAAAVFCMCSGVLAAETGAVLSVGKTYRFTNSDNDKYCFITSKTQTSAAVYDYVSYDKDGIVEGCGSQKGSFIVGAGGSIVVTVTGKNAINITYNNAQVKITEEKTPALFRHVLNEGKTVQITNKDLSADYNLFLSAVDAKKLPKYDYVKKDIAGYAADFSCNSEAGTAEALAGCAMLVTAKIDMEIYIPYEWYKSLSFEDKSSKSLYTYALPAGGTVSVVNNDLYKDYYIANDANADAGFSYASYDSFQNAQEFANKENFTEKTPVCAGGVTVITSESERELNLYLPEEWAKNLTFNKTNEPALYSVTLPSTKTLRIHNGGNAAYTIKGNNDESDSAPKTDCVFIDTEGRVTGYANDGQNGEVIADTGFDTLVTVNNGYPLKLWMPYKWLESITFSETEETVMHTITLNPNESYEIKNKNKSSVFTFSAEGSGKYDYVLKSSAGSVIEYGSANLPAGLSLDIGESILITAGKSQAVKVYIPERWLNNGVEAVKKSYPALYEYTLRAGSSVILENAMKNNSASRVIKTNSGERLSPKLDYTLRDKTGRVTDYKAEDYYSEIILEDSGNATVTAGKDYSLKLIMPFEWVDGKAVTIKESSAPAVYYKTVKTGQGLVITNKDKDSTVNVSAVSGEALYDFVYSDNTGRVFNCGIAVNGEIFDIGPECTYSLTVGKTSDLTLYMPYEWSRDKVSITSGQGSCVFSYTLLAGATVEIVNSNRNNAYFICAEGVNGSTASYDYVNKNEENAITDYGIGAEGEILLSKSGKTTITANKDGNLTLYFPNAWKKENSISLNQKAESVITTYTIVSGKSMDISNKSNYAYQIENNSGEGRTNPKYDYTYVQGEQYNENVNGVIDIPPMAAIKLKASNGYDLKFWLPTEWLKQLTIR